MHPARRCYYLNCWILLFMRVNLWKNLSKSNDLNLTEKFNTSFRYPNDLCSLDNSFFHTYIKNIYPKELILLQSNDDKATFLDLDVQINNLHCTIKIYDKRYDFDFNIVNFPQLDGDVPSSPTYGTCNRVEDFNERNSRMSRKLLKQGLLYHKLRKTFAKFYNRHFYLVKQFNLINLIEGVYRIHISMGISSKRLKK